MLKIGISNQLKKCGWCKTMTTRRIKPAQYNIISIACENCFSDEAINKLNTTYRKVKH